MKPTLLALSTLLAIGCAGQGEQPPKTEQPVIEGPLRAFELKTSETSRAGGGDFTIPVYGKLYRDYLLITYKAGTDEEFTDVVPANRIWKVTFSPKDRLVTKPSP